MSVFDDIVSLEEYTAVVGQRDALQAENDRLRAALRQLVFALDDDCTEDDDCIIAVARQALAKLEEK